MIIKIKKLLFCALIILFTIIFTPVSFAAVSLPWSTTYNCADWAQKTASIPATSLLNCDGLSQYGEWATQNGSREQVTPAANYFGGAGGSGQRHWTGDGITNNSGGLSLSLNPQTEVWIRWYMRYEAGFQFNPLNQYKVAFLNPNTSPSIIIGYNWSDQLTIHPQSVGNPIQSTIGTGWNAIMVNGGTDANGNKTADGQWHLWEVHIKMYTTTLGSSDGIAQLWIDGIQRINATNVYFGTTTIDTFEIGSNSRFPNNGRDMAVDYDDIAISTTGYIGPISGGSASDTTPPSAPSGVAVN